MNLAKYIFGKSRSYLDKPAIIFEGQTYTYRELERKAGQYVNLLARLGVNKGDVVALQLSKGMEFIYLHLANLLLGAVTLPLNPGYTRGEIEYFLDDSGCRFFFAERGFDNSSSLKPPGKKNFKTILKDNNSSGQLASLLKEAQTSETDNFKAQEIDADHTALLCYTSGTTGKPKGALITHRNLVFNALALQKVWRWTKDDLLLHVLPLFHVHGLCVALHGGLNAGSTLVVHEKFDPLKSLQTIATMRCTMFMAVPTIYYRLLQTFARQKTDLSSMRVFISGSAPLSKELFTDFYNATGFRILERYGMTETQMIASNPYEPDKRIPGSVGYPLPGVRIRLAGQSGADCHPGEIGEVWVKGENVFKGYWRRPEKTEEAFSDKWFKTGDLGYQDEKDGMRLYLAGREKELIISGGYNVYPLEVEEVLNQHQAVREAAVVGIGHKEYGELVVAAVVLNRTGRDISEEDLISFCKEKLAGYKCPKRIQFIEKMPLNTMGKIQKNLVRSEFQSFK